MCNSIQRARKRREINGSYATSLSTTVVAAGSNQYRQQQAREHAKINRAVYEPSVEPYEPEATTLTDEVALNMGYRGRGMDNRINYGLGASNEFCSGSLADLLGYEPMKKVSPDGSLSPPSATATTAAAAAAGGLAKLSESTYDSDDSGSPRRKQRRMPDTGTTAKGHQRQYAQHNYHDHANDEVTSTFEPKVNSASSLLTPMRGGVIAPFPLRLHTMLEGVEKEGMADIVCWQPHGRAFVVHDSKRFVRQIMPRFFRQHKYSSFQRQLNLYGFMRLTKKGRDHGGYYHELFLRDRGFLCAAMQRVRVKGTLVRTSSSPETEPDFYTMPFVERRRLEVVTTTKTTTSPSAASTKSDAILLEEVRFNMERYYAPNQQYEAMSPIQQPLHRPYLVHSDQALIQTPQSDAMNAMRAAERHGAAPIRRLGLQRTPSEEADLARFLDGVDLYSSDVETTAAV